METPLGNLVAGVQWLESTFANRFNRFRRDQGHLYKPQTFDFLGFTHYWRKTKRGGYAVTRQTKGKKFRAALANIADWCKRHRHEPVAQQHRKLSESG